MQARFLEGIEKRWQIQRNSMSINWILLSSEFYHSQKFKKKNRFSHNFKIAQNLVIQIIVFFKAEQQEDIAEMAIKDSFLLWTHVLVLIGGSVTPVLHLMTDEALSSLGLDMLRTNKSCNPLQLCHQTCATNQGRLLFHPAFEMTVVITFGFK